MQVSSSFIKEAHQVRTLWQTVPLVRAVNFHSTPSSRKGQFEKQLALWSRSFDSVDEQELDGYLKTGRWEKSKPGLIVAMYNGYRDNYDVLGPMLEEYGFIGWFFVPTAFVGTPLVEQRGFGVSRTLRLAANEYPDGRYALSWDELRTLDRKHVVACHTRNHARLRDEHSVEDLANEIIGPQRDFEQYLGHRVRSFASLSGAAYGEQALADRLIDEAQYQFVFSNLKIQRLRDFH